MDNDFVQGMEMLMRCKKYVEIRLETLYKMTEQRNKFGRDTMGLKKEIARCEYTLGYRKSLDVEED